MNTATEQKLIIAMLKGDRALQYAITLADALDTDYDAEEDEHHGPTYNIVSQTTTIKIYLEEQPTILLYSTSSLEQGETDEYEYYHPETLTELNASIEDI